MPIIARTSETVRMQSNAPVQIASTSDARIAGDTMARFGSEVQDFASKQIEVNRNLSRGEFKDAMENNVKAAQAYADQNSAPDGSDYGDKFYEVAQPRTEELMNQYGGYDPRLKSEFQSYTQRLKGDVDTSIMIKSAQMMETNNFARAEKLMVSSADRLRENIPTDPKSIGNYVQAEMQSFQNVVDGMKLAPENAAKMKQAYKETAAISFIDGLGNKQRYGEALRSLTATQKTPDVYTSFTPEKAQELGFIDSREAKALSDKGEAYKVPVLTDKKGQALPPGVSELLTGLSPLKKAAMIDQMRSKVEAQTQVRLSDLNASITGFQKHALTGGMYDDRQLGDLKQQINTAPNLTAIARARLMDQVNTADAFNMQLRVSATTPRSQWGDLVGGASEKIAMKSAEAAKSDPRMGELDRDFAVISRREEAMHSFQTSLVQMKAQQDKDPAAFIMATDQEVQLLAKGTGDGQGLQKFTTTLLNKQARLGMPLAPLTKDQAAQSAKEFQAMPDSESRAQRINQLQMQYGEHFPRVLNQIAKTDKNLVPLQATVHMDPNSRAGAIDALMNKSAIMAKMKEPEFVVQASEVDKAVVLEMAPFRTSVVGATNESSAFGVVGGIQDLVALQAKRDVLRGTKPEDAAKKAYQDVVGSQYHIVSGKGQSQVLVPKSIIPEGNNIVQNYMNTMTPDDLGVYAPEKIQRAKWVSNETQTGIRYVEQLPDGSLQPIFDKNGQKIEADYNTINLRPPKKVIEASKNVFQRMFGG